MDFGSDAQRGRGHGRHCLKCSCHDSEASARVRDRLEAEQISLTSRALGRAAGFKGVFHIA